jgi:hypothetical protein
MNERDGWGTKEPYYPFYKTKSGSVSVGNPEKQGSARSDAQKEDRFQEEGAVERSARLARVELHRRKKLQIIKEWSLKTMKDYPDLWSHHEMASLLTNKSSLEYQALHLKEEVDKKTEEETKKEEEKEEDKNNRSATVRRNASRSYIDVNSAEWREAAAKKKRRMEIEKKEGEEKAKKKNVKAVVVATRIGVAPSAQQKHGERTKLVTSSSASSPLVLGEVVDEPLGGSTLPTSDAESETTLRFKQQKKLTRGNKGGDGVPLTQEVEDGADFVAEQRKKRTRLRQKAPRKRSTKRSVGAVAEAAEAAEAGEAMPKNMGKREGEPENVSSHSIRTAFSLLQRKFDRHRDAATEKLAKLEIQLGQMRRQHEQRQRTRRLRSQRKDD